jgi:hypothetical protein
MSARDWAVLAFKLLGLWFAASGVTGLGNIPYLLQSDHEAAVRLAGALGVAFPSVMSFVVGALIWINAGGLATHAVGADPAELAANVFGDGPTDAPARGARIEMQPLFALALAIIGVLMLVEAVPSIVYGTTMFVRSRQAGTAIFGPDPAQQARLWDASTQATFAGACTRLLIGLALLLGPARLSAAYGRVRAELRGTLADDATADAAAKTSPAAADREGADGAGKAG